MPKLLSLDFVRSPLSGEKPDQARSEGAALGRLSVLEARDLCSRLDAMRYQLSGLRQASGLSVAQFFLLSNGDSHTFPPYPTGVLQDQR